MSRRTGRVVPAAALALAAALLLGACGTDGTGAAGRAGPPAPAEGGGAAKAPELKATGAFIPEPVDTRSAGGFLTIANSGAADRLTAVTSDLSDDVQLHEVVDGRMRQVDSFAVPAGGELELVRGGDHLMFMDLARKPAEGDTVGIELRFEKSAPIRLDVPVESRIHDPGRH